MAMWVRWPSGGALPVGVMQWTKTEEFVSCPKCRKILGLEPYEGGPPLVADGFEEALAAKGAAMIALFLARRRFLSCRNPARLRNAREAGRARGIEPGHVEDHR